MFLLGRTSGGPLAYQPPSISSLVQQQGVEGRDAVVVTDPPRKVQTALRRIYKEMVEAAGIAPASEDRRPCVPTCVAPFQIRRRRCPGRARRPLAQEGSRRVSLEHGFPASLFVGAVSVEQAIYGETTRGLSRECQFLIGSCNVPSCFTRPLGPRHATQNVMISVEPIRPPFVVGRKRPSALCLTSEPFLLYRVLRLLAFPDPASNFAVGFATFERLTLVRTGLALGQGQFNLRASGLIKIQF